MRSPVARCRLTLTLALGAAASLLTVVACQVEAPADPSTANATAAATPRVSGRPGPVFVPANHVYSEFQIEQPATPKAGTVTPRYPDPLRQAGVEGEVLVQFVVRPNGRADVGTLKILTQSHELFGNAVRAALPQMEFNPALVGGRAVSQLVQSPFTFSLTR